VDVAVAALLAEVVSAEHLAAEQEPTAERPEEPVEVSAGESPPVHAHPQGPARSEGLDPLQLSDRVEVDIAPAVVPARLVAALVLDPVRVPVVRESADQIAASGIDPEPVRVVRESADQIAASGIDPEPVRVVQESADRIAASVIDPARGPVHPESREPTALIP
jgi:hypothetical protein